MRRKSPTPPPIAPWPDTDQTEERPDWEDWDREWDDDYTHPKRKPDYRRQGGRKRGFDTE